MPNPFNTRISLIDTKPRVKGKLTSTPSPEFRAKYMYVAREISWESSTHEISSPQNLQWIIGCDVFILISDEEHKNWDFSCTASSRDIWHLGVGTSWIYSYMDLSRFCLIFEIEGFFVDHGQTLLISCNKVSWYPTLPIFLPLKN